MATQAQASAPPRKARRATPFAGSIAMVWVGLVATAIGFLPTFFMRLGSVDAAHLIHGWTMIGWLLLVLTQATLIGRGKYRVHRILGWCSLGLFVAMVGSSLQMMAMMLSPASKLPFPVAKFFGYSDFADMPLLFLLFGSAIRFRKDRHLHSRLIGATVMTSIVPALARMYNILIWRSMDGLNHAMHPTYLTILVTLGILIMIDRRNGNLRWPLPLTFAWFTVVYATQWLIMDVAWYDRLAHTIGALA
ncbi:MAG: hypothetical protein KGK11_13525 [Sphingomonadales bacterium]|nr:hypothetical protein [Sphingomonadales bacterium]